MSTLKKSGIYGQKSIFKGNLESKRHKVEWISTKIFWYKQEQGKIFFWPWKFLGKKNFMMMDRFPLEDFHSQKSPQELSSSFKTSLCLLYMDRDIPLLSILCSRPGFHSPDLIIFEDIITEQNNFRWCLSAPLFEFPAKKINILKWKLVHSNSCSLPSSFISFVHGTSSSLAPIQKIHLELLFKTESYQIPI